MHKNSPLFFKKYYSGVGPAKTVKNTIIPAATKQIKLIDRNKYRKKPCNFSFVKIVKATETNISPIPIKDIHIFNIGSLVKPVTPLYYVYYYFLPESL